MEVKIGRDELMKMIRQTTVQGRNYFDHFEQRRDIDIFTETSYRGERYRVWFFHVRGSPFKMIGWIYFFDESVTPAFRMTTHTWHSRAKTFYFDQDFKRTTYSNLMLKKAI